MVDDGFADLTMAELATRLNCSLRTLYELAPSRDVPEVVLDVVEVVAADRVDGERRAVAAPPGALPPSPVTPANSAPSASPAAASSRPPPRGPARRSAPRRP